MRGLIRSLGIFFLLSNFLFGKTLIGVGIGKTQVIAKEMALKDLSDNIYVDVVSESESFLKETEDDFNLDNNIIINSFSKNFLLGVKYKGEKISGGYKIKAILDDESFRIYRDNINRIDAEILEFYSYEGDQREKLEYLKVVELKLEERKKLEDVLSYVGFSGVPKSQITLGKLKREVSSLNKKLSQRKKIYIDLKGEVKEKHRVELLNDIKRSSTDNRFILTADDKGIDFYIDIEILEMTKKIIPKSAVKPERYVISYNCNLVAIKEQTGQEILAKTISNKIEGYNERLNEKESIESLGREIFNELNKSLL